jgi:8-hydroxy-5-deazaflavin:NADPH oxidoreductase
MTPLNGWENFYVIVGSSAGALIGLQFVVITLIANLPIQGAGQASGAFSTPSVVHFGIVLLLSALITAPWNGIFTVSLFWGLVGLCGAVYAVVVARRMRKQTIYQPVFEDWLCHVLLPVAAYAALAASAFMAHMAHSDVRPALFLVGAAALLLLFIGITMRGMLSRIMSLKDQSWRNKMRVGILGSGLMGAKLGTIFARAGHEVIFSYARNEQKLKKLAQEAKGKAKSGTPHEAVQEADALLLAVHWSRIEDVLKQTGDLSDKVIVTCSLPMNADNTELIIAHTSSGAEELAKKVPKAQVVCAFNSVPSEVLFGVYESKRKTGRPSLVYCGDNSSSKRIAAELIRDVGFDPVDVGPLKIARYTEPFALLVAQMAYEGKGGPELAYRLEWFGK